MNEVVRTETVGEKTFQLIKHTYFDKVRYWLRISRGSEVKESELGNLQYSTVMYDQAVNVAKELLTYSR